MTTAESVHRTIRRAALGCAFLAFAATTVVGGATAANATTEDNCKGTSTLIGSNGAGAYCHSGSGNIRAWVACSHGSWSEYVYGPWVWSNAADPNSATSTAFCPSGYPRVYAWYNGADSET